MKLRNAEQLAQFFEEQRKTHDTSIESGMEWAMWWAAWQSAEVLSGENTRSLANILLQGIRPIDEESVECEIESFRDFVRDDLEFEEDPLTEEQEEQIDKVFMQTLLEWIK